MIVSGAVDGIDYIAYRTAITEHHLGGRIVGNLLHELPLKIGFKDRFGRHTSSVADDQYRRHNSQQVNDA